MIYPSNSWDLYETILKRRAERRSLDTSDVSFLVEIGLLNTTNDLTEAGQAYFEARFIAKDEATALAIMQPILKNYSPVLAITQRLFGVPGINKSTVDSLLRNVCLHEELTDRKLGTLLSILTKFKIITYAKGRGEITVLIPPLDSGKVPNTVFISRETPFSNVMWLTRVLRECKDHVYWLDKHFQPSGFEAIADAADGNRIQDIRILSLELPMNSTPKAKKAYTNLKQELLTKNIILEWRYIDSKLLRDTHDRWIIGNDSAVNVPDVGTIMSGNKSEISISSSSTRLNNDFLKYWISGNEVV